MPTATDRQQNILKVLNETDKISITELTDTLYYSESSIRRDLRALEKLGLIISARGCVSLKKGSNFELPVIARSNEHRSQKQSIAQYASSLVNNGDTIFLDSSTTVTEMLPFLSNYYDLTIITNGIYTLSQAHNYIDGTLICLGGILRKSSGSALTGSFTRDNISHIHCDKMFFSSRAIDSDFGISDSSENEADIKRHMIDMADEIFYLGDSSKFNIMSTFDICSLDVPKKIITDKGFNLETPAWNRISEKIEIVL